MPKNRRKTDLPAVRIIPPKHAHIPAVNSCAAGTYCFFERLINETFGAETWVSRCALRTTHPPRTWQDARPWQMPPSVAHLAAKAVLAHFFGTQVPSVGVVHSITSRLMHCNTTPNVLLPCPISAVFRDELARRTFSRLGGVSGARSRKSVLGRVTLLNDCEVSVSSGVALIASPRGERPMLILYDTPNTANEDCWEHQEVDGLRITSFVRWPGDNGGKSVKVLVNVSALGDRVGENIGTRHAQTALLTHRDLILKLAQAKYRKGDAVVTLDVGDFRSVVEWRRYEAANSTLSMSVELLLSARELFTRLDTGHFCRRSFGAGLSSSTPASPFNQGLKASAASSTGIRSCTAAAARGWMAAAPRTIGMVLTNPTRALASSADHWSH